MLRARQGSEEQALRLGSDGVNRDLLALAVITLESHDAFDQSVDGEVASEADVAAWVKLRSTLTDEDFARIDFLAAITLHAQHLGIAIATVLGATACFFVCHCVNPLIRLFAPIGVLRLAAKERSKF